MRLTSLKLNNLRDVYIQELRDLYDAETRLVDSLPRVAEAASARTLRSALEHHLSQTREHVHRLEQIFEGLGEKPQRETCEGMKGLLKEGEIYVDATGNNDARDAGLIVAAQKVEHYEIAGYGAARSLAAGADHAADIA